MNKGSKRVIVCNSSNLCMKEEAMAPQTGMLHVAPKGPALFFIPRRQGLHFKVIADLIALQRLEDYSDYPPLWAD